MSEVALRPCQLCAASDMLNYLHNDSPLPLPSTVPSSTKSLLLVFTSTPLVSWGNKQAGKNYKKSKECQHFKREGIPLRSQSKETVWNCLEDNSYSYWAATPCPFTYHPISLLPFMALNFLYIHGLHDLTSYCSFISLSTAFWLLSYHGSETVLPRVSGSFPTDNYSGSFSACILLAVCAALSTWPCLRPWNIFSLDFLWLSFVCLAAGVTCVNSSFSAHLLGLSPRPSSPVTQHFSGFSFHLNSH